jgi:ABC-type amino acid transport substrate-binding protein
MLVALALHAVPIAPMAQADAGARAPFAQTAPPAEATPAIGATHSGRGEASPDQGTSGALTHPRTALRVPQQVPALPRGTRVRVAVCDLPPWAIPPTASNAAWSGLSIHLVREVAAALDLDIELRTYDLEGVLAAIERGDADIAGVAVPITAENLSRFSMTPAFDESGMSIATHLRPPLRFITVIRHVTNEQVLLWSGTLALMCVLFGAMLWAMERRRNPPFEGAPMRGIAEASWWSVVTMFTVGYGDRVPVTVRGKFVAVAWMALSFILVTVASGLVTSALTVQQLRPVVSGAAELAKAQVGCVEGSDGERFLRNAGIPFTPYRTYEQAVAALAAARIEAIVGSTMALEFLITRSHSTELTVLPQALRRDYVGFPMRYGLPEALEKRFELEMLKVSQSDVFRAYRSALVGRIGREEE